jgi:putative MATE family efflux protein
MSQHTLRTESLVQLTWPIFLQHMAHSCVLVVDFWFFSHLSDTIAGVVGQLMPIIWMGAFVIPVFAGTGVSVASQYMGAKQYDKVVPAYMMNLACTATMGVGYAAFLWIFSADIGRWMGLDETLNGISTTYLAWESAYFVFLGISVAYNAVLSSRGMTHWLMYNSFVVAGVNLLLASVFVLGLGWGVRGVVAAAVIGMASAMVLSIWHVHGRLGVVFSLKDARHRMAGIFRPMMRIGISNALEPFSYTVQQIVISTLIISMGLTAMASNSYANRAQMFQITFAVSLALGSQILMAHWMGARRFSDVNALFWKAIRRATLVAFVYAFALWCFSDWVLGFFTEDPAVKELGKTLLLIAVFYEPARAVNIIGGFSLKTVGDARFPLIIGMLFIWGILPVIYFVKETWGISLVALWLCFAFDEIIRAGINLWRWRTGRWKTMGLTEPATSAPGATTPADTLPLEP